MRQDAQHGRENQNCHVHESVILRRNKRAKLIHCAKHHNSDTDDGGDIASAGSLKEASQILRKKLFHNFVLRPSDYTSNETHG